jgi:hypothetical protein
MLYFHIGAPKTGTNAIQRFLMAHGPRLAELGVVYAEPGRDGRHKHDALKAEFSATTGLGGEAFAALRALHTAQPDKHIIVSEEAFYRCSADEVKRLAGGMLGDGPVTVLAWLRDSAGHVVSTYGQAVKGGRRTEDFDAFFDEYMAGPSNAETLSRWGDAFGWDRVQLRLYSPQTLRDGDAVSDFLQVLGLERGQFEGDGAKPAKPNASPGWESVELTRAVCAEMAQRSGVSGVRRITSALRSAIRKAAEAAAPEGSRTEYLTAEQRARCNAATRADIEALNRHLPAPGLPMPELREGPARAALPSVAGVPSDVVAAAMAILALELGGDLPDEKRARKKARNEHVTGSAEARRERRAARRAATADGSASGPATSLRRRTGKPDKPDKSDKPAKVRKADKPPRAGKSAKAGKENKPPRTAEQKAARRARKADKAAAETPPLPPQAPATVGPVSAAETTR